MAGGTLGLTREGQKWALNNILKIFRGDFSLYFGFFFLYYSTEVHLEMISLLCTSLGEDLQTAVQDSE